MTFSAPTIDTLHAAYREGTLTPATVVDEFLSKASSVDPAIWITLLDRAQIQVYLDQLKGQSPDSLPLYGILFAIKDNIDLAGVPTTAACPAYSYTPDKSAPVVQALIDAGAIPVGKTNLDQFATGLVGTRSPYGIPVNALSPGVISGGSSSGSAVATALGLVTFALGTDTAGSGRVPAAFNNIIGFKPTRGVLSTTGLVPACRSLDCISVFSLTTEDAAKVFAITNGFDAKDPLARPFTSSAPGWAPGTSFLFGILPESQRSYFGEDQANELYENSITCLRALGGIPLEVDFEPFLKAARLLYGGPWVAERYLATAKLMESQPDAFLPVTHAIISGGAKSKATDAFRSMYELADLRRASEAVWRQVDLMLTPTAPRSYTIAEVEANPIALNTNLGTYTNFMNLLDLCGCAVPAGFLPNGRAWGVTIMAPAFHDLRLLSIAGFLHQATGVTLGASQAPVPAPAKSLSTQGWMPIAVCGAHMEGLPLNPSLLACGAYLRERTHTAPVYKLYYLSAKGPVPPRPGLIKVNEGGAAIALEIWDIPISALGGFFGTLKPPLSLGWVELADGSSVCGFLCEPSAVSMDQDITQHGGWRAWLTVADAQVISP